MTEQQFRKGQRVHVRGFFPGNEVDEGTFIDGPHEGFNGAYLVAVDGDGLNYVAPGSVWARDEQDPAEETT